MPANASYTVGELRFGRRIAVGLWLLSLTEVAALFAWALLPPLI